MFSFFDFLRRRACDSIVAGAYDAMEILEKRPAEEVGENSDAKILDPPNNGKPPGSAQPSVNPESPKKILAAPSPLPNSGGDLFATDSGNESDAPLPPRKRGRPPKNPPVPPSQP